MRYTLFSNSLGTCCIADHEVAKVSIYSKSIAGILCKPAWRNSLEGSNSYSVLQGTYPESCIVAHFDNLDTFIYDHPELFI